MYSFALRLATLAAAASLVPATRAAAACHPDLPAPDLAVVGTEEYTGSDGNPYLRFQLDVRNRAAYPDELWEPAPDLPACGLNETSSRSWVDIFGGDGTRIYGFCGLDRSAELDLIWFAVPMGSYPPPSIYVTIVDRRCDLAYTSNLAPTDVDADGDSLPDVWERYGADTDGDGTIDVDLRALGANADRADLFLELDCLTRYDATGAVEHTHCPVQNAVERVARAFADAPVANRDGTTGVQLHVDTGALHGAGVVFPVAGAGGVTATYGDLSMGAALGGGEQIAEAGNEIVDWNGAAGDPATSFFDLKAAHFGAARSGIFKYGLFVHQVNARAPANDCTSGWGGGDNFMVSLGGVGTWGGPCWGTDAGGASVGTEAQQAGTFLHEYGHTLALGHGGADGVNHKPNYLSVMNYSFQMCRVTSSPAAGLPGGCDLSRHALATLSEILPPGLDECAGVDGSVLGLGAVDFDGSGVLDGATCSPTTANVSADVNRDGALTALLGSNDWQRLRYRLWSRSPGDSPPPPVVDADPQEIERAERQLVELMDPSLRVEIGAAPGRPGETVAAEVRVANAVANGSRGPALAARLAATRPDGSQQSFDLGLVALGATLSRSVELRIPADACPGSSSASATVRYQDVLGNDELASASAAIPVLDDVPPSVTAISAQPAILWPPNGRRVEVTVVTSATDACTAAPTCAIQSVTSSEPGPDQWQIRDATHVYLRAQRDGGGSGRTYRIDVRCTDASGNAATASVTVEVPHDQRRTP